MKRRGRPRMRPEERIDKTLAYALRQDEYDAVKRVCKERGVTPSAAARAAVMAWVRRMPTPVIPEPDRTAERIEAAKPAFNQLARAGNILNQIARELLRDGVGPDLKGDILAALKTTRAALANVQEQLAKMVYG